MTADINIGDNYELDEDSNGDLVIRDSTGNAVLEHTDGAGWDVLRPIADEEYRVADSNQNIVGTLFAESDGTLTLQEGTSGNENELVLQPDGTVQAKRLTGAYIYAGAFDGADADARLDNALAAANSGDTIFLEPEKYSKDRTFTKLLRLSGTAAGTGAGTTVGGNTQWQSDSRTEISRLRLEGELILNGDTCRVAHISSPPGVTITVKDDRCILVGIRRAEVIFESGTSECVVDSSTAIIVNDRGSNTVGDLG